MSGYTSSERKGIIAVALISLVLIAGGVVLSLCGRKLPAESIPIVVEHSEMIDSAAIKSKRDSNHHKTKGKQKSSGENKESKKKKVKEKKTFRKRNPLKEPV